MWFLWKLAGNNLYKKFIFLIFHGWNCQHKNLQEHAYIAVPFIFTVFLPTGKLILNRPQKQTTKVISVKTKNKVRQLWNKFFPSSVPLPHLNVWKIFNVTNPDTEHTYKILFKTHFFLKTEAIEVVVITLYDFWS